MKRLKYDSRKDFDLFMKLSMLYREIDNEVRENGFVSAMGLQEALTEVIYMMSTNIMFNMPVSDDVYEVIEYMREYKSPLKYLVQDKDIDLSKFEYERLN